MNTLEMASTSELITKAWHAAGIFRKPVEEFSFQREKFIQYHRVDIEEGKKIITQNLIRNSTVMIPKRSFRSCQD